MSLEDHSYSKTPLSLFMCQKALQLVVSSENSFKAFQHLLHGLCFSQVSHFRFYRLCQVNYCVICSAHSVSCVDCWPDDLSFYCGLAQGKILTEGLKNRQYQISAILFPQRIVEFPFCWEDSTLIPPEKLMQDHKTYLRSRGS